MNLGLEDQIDKLRRTIANLEDQRSALGDSVVESALAPLRLRLEELDASMITETRAEEVSEEQRKMVSVLCGDLVDFTALSSKLDPEELREIQQAYFAAITPPIQERGGKVEKYIGDAVLAVFGLPQAREDDPEQAVRAALEMQATLEQLNERRKGEIGFPLQMRIGVNTGPVLATLGRKGEEFVVTGETVNLASRLQGLASSRGVLISQDTYRHLRGVFDVQALDPVKVKGIAEPVQVYQVLRARPRTFRQVVRGVEGIETPLVGRKDELKYLQEALLGAIEDREGQVVTISGEAGVGKSRMLYEFQNWIDLLPPPPVRFFQGKARQEAQGLPYGLLRDLVAFRFQILDDDQVEEVWRKVEEGFGDVFGGGEVGQMRAHILGQLLGYDFSQSKHLKGVMNEAEQLRNQGVMYLVEYFKGLCEKGPVVVFLEDLHWGDDSSLDAINRLGEMTPHQSLLIVCAARQTLLERRPYWGEGLRYHHFVDLQPLSRRESRQLVGEILKLVQEIPQELRDLVVEGGEGNPFYIEELIKMLVESGVILKGEDRWGIAVDRLEQLTVPATLAGVLQARLDSLPTEERVVLQQASVVGRLFWDRVVAYIHSAQEEMSEEDKVPKALAALRGRELVYRREESAFVDAREYLFKHDILREVTYESVLKKLRKAYHALAADWLITHSGERVGEYRGLIAEHLLLGGRKEGALKYLQEAGEAALASFANPEAEGYFRQALELATDTAQKADLLAGLGKALRRRAKREEAIQILRHGIDLYHQLDNLDKVADMYAGLSRVLWEIDYIDAWQVCQEGLELLEDAPDSPGLAHLLAEAGRVAYFKGEPSDRVEDLCQRASTMAAQLGEVAMQAEALITLAMQFGDPSEAIRMMEQAVALTEAIGPCSTTARAYTDLGCLYDLFYVDLDAALRNRVKASEIYRQIGDIDGMILSLEGTAHVYLEMGTFNFLPMIEVELHRSTALQERIDRFLDSGSLTSSCILYYRGEWEQAAQNFHAILDELHKGGNLQYIAESNIYLMSTLFELNYFADREDLSEAEASMLEIVEKGGWDLLEIPFFLVVVFTRQGRLLEARTQLAEGVEALGRPKNNRNRWCLLNAEAELARREERWDQAASASQSLIEIFKAGGFRWSWARELIYLGDTLRHREKPGDLEYAREIYQQSLEMFTEMGAPGYIAALEARLRAVE